MAMAVLNLGLKVTESHRQITIGGLLIYTFIYFKAQLPLMSYCIQLAVLL